LRNARARTRSSSTGGSEIQRCRAHGRGTARGGVDRVAVSAGSTASGSTVSSGPTQPAIAALADLAQTVRSSLPAAPSGSSETAASSCAPGASISGREDRPTEERKSRAVDNEYRKRAATRAAAGARLTALAAAATAATAITTYVVDERASLATATATATAAVAVIAITAIAARSTHPEVADHEPASSPGTRRTTATNPPGISRATIAAGTTTDRDETAQSRDPPQSTSGARSSGQAVE
jgi:hypothetical protein